MIPQPLVPGPVWWWGGVGRGEGDTLASDPRSCLVVGGVGRKEGDARASGPRSFGEGGIPASDP